MLARLTFPQLVGWSGFILSSLFILGLLFGPLA
jgi:hypothetical protein